MVKVADESVKYFDGNKFYEILFNLKDEVCDKSIKASYQDYKSIIVYYKYLKQLYIKVRPYIKKEKVKEDLYEELIETKSKEMHQLLNVEMSKTKGKKTRIEHKKNMIKILSELEKSQITLFENMKDVELPFKKIFNPHKAIGQGFD